MDDVDSVPTLRDAVALRDPERWVIRALAEALALSDDPKTDVRWFEPLVAD